MARRGVMTALQAALAGIGGAAGGYVQQQELERKRQEAERERKRQEQRDLITFGREAITPGPLATRAPAGLPTTEMPAGAPPSAIPMPTGKVDFGGAMRQLEQEEAVPSGTEAIEIGGRTLYIPVGQRYRDIKRSEELQAEQSALDAAIARARAEGQVKREFGEEDFQTTNKRDFDTFKALGGRGEYRPNVIYSKMITDLSADKALAGQRSLITARIQAAGAGAGGAAGASRAERIATLPTVANAAEKLAKMDPKSVAALSGFGVSAASQVPQILTQTRGGFSGMLALPTAAMYGQAAGSKEREYAEMTQAISDAVASMVSVGVLTDKDIDRFKQQVQFYPGDESKDKIRKFNSMRSWASWLQSGGQGKYPGETDDEYFQRASMLRAQPGAGTQATRQQGTGAMTAPADAQTERERQAWDTLAAQYGEAAVRDMYGERP